MGKIRTTIAIDELLWGDLRREALNRGVTAQDLIEDAIRGLLGLTEHSISEMPPDTGRYATGHSFNSRAHRPEDRKPVVSKT